MSHRYLLILLGFGLMAIGIVERGWLLLILWLGADFLLLGIAHVRGVHRVFGKRQNGSIPLWSWLIFFPLLIYIAAVWHLIRFFSREPALNTVTSDLLVGRRLLSGECEGEFKNFVDLTAEFVEPSSIRKCPGYFCFPILDGAAPDTESLRRALSHLKPGRTFIHCAQGRGRTGLFALAVLLNSGAARTVEDGLRMLQVARPGIRLSREQRKCIEQFAAVPETNPNDSGLSAARSTAK
jgi:protein-tyrosine phosphatase